MDKVKGRGVRPMLGHKLLRATRQPGPLGLPYRAHKAVFVVFVGGHFHVRAGDGPTARGADLLRELMP